MTPILLFCIYYQSILITSVEVCVFDNNWLNIQFFLWFVLSEDLDLRREEDGGNHAGKLNVSEIIRLLSEDSLGGLARWGISIWFLACLDFVMSRLEDVFSNWCLYFLIIKYLSCDFTFWSNLVKTTESEIWKTGRARHSWEMTVVSFSTIYFQ